MGSDFPPSPPQDGKPWESFSSAMLRSLIRPSPLLSFFSGEAASLFLFFPIPLFLTLPDLPRDSYPGRRLFLLFLPFLPKNRRLPSTAGTLRRRL